MKVYLGYTTSTKVRSGFLNRNGYSAHIKEAGIEIQELDEELDEIAIEEGYKAIVRVPQNLIGSAYMGEGPDSIFCKSLGQAKSIMNARPHRNEAFLRVEKDGWRLTAEEAARDAAKELAERAAQRQGRQSMTRESAIDQLREAGILSQDMEISEKVWRKPKAKLRIQAALAGDSSSAGCLRRDANKV